MYRPRITVEIEGIEEVQDLIEKVRMQMNELESTIHSIMAKSLEIQAKINQPPTAIDD